MPTNDEIFLEELKRDEGFRDHAYQDSLGYWTIGYGRLIDKRKGGRITKEESEMLLCNDVSLVIDQLDARLPWWRKLDPVRQRVVANMAYNLGINKLLGFKNTLKMIEAGQYDQASKGMLQSLWAKQVGQRAVRLADMMKKGTI